MSVWQLGDNIKAEGYVEGMTSRLVEITGTGDMYDDASQFLNITDDTPWYTLISLCKSNLIIPDGITSIAANFWNTGDYIQDTSYVYISKDVTRIGNSAFENTAGKGILTLEVGTPSVLKTLGSRVFAGCSWIKDINFHGTVEEVGEACFQNCVSLEYVNLSMKIGMILEDTFGNCPSLIRFNNRNKISGWSGLRCFYKCNKLEYLEIADDFQINHSYFDTSLFVENGAGANCDENGYFITKLKTKSVNLIAYPAEMQWNRVFVFVNGTEFIYIAHKGKWIKISGYNEGDIPVSHENVYLWIRLVEQGEISGSPVFIKHNNKWLQLEY